MSAGDLKFSIYMKELRLKAGFSVDEAARKIGVGVSTVEDWERGLSFPSELSAQRISSVYKVSQQEWLEALKKHYDSLLNSQFEN